ncbi:MAG: site-specific integrase [SAR324 cluster bacterium]|uniref:Site-specific integrase n=1 Tax=SAR324 cluster bacterium TaxID=2024889 RepID=A0A7X9FPY0_9DELT|nr:site-specific integrase [SAR324 cluster bacterium]
MRKPRNLEIIEKVEPGIWKARDKNLNQFLYFIQVSKRTKGSKKQRLTRQATTDGVIRARAKKAALLTELNQECIHGPKITFGDFLTSEYLPYINVKKRPSSVIRERSAISAHFLPKLKDRPIFHINQRECEDLINEAAKNKSSQTRKHLIIHLSNVFKLAVRQRVIVNNPCDLIERPVVETCDPKVLNQQQMQALLDYLGEHYPIMFYHVSVSFFTLARAGEVRALTWGDIDFQENQIDISKTLDPKSGLQLFTKNKKSRKVWINPPLHQILMELREETYAGPTSPVLPYWREFASGEQGKPLKIICRSLGLPEIRYHDLRATGITLMLCKGEALPVVMKTAGHKRLSSTQVYLRLSGVETTGSTDSIALKIRQPESKSFSTNLSQETKSNDKIIRLPDRHTVKKEINE